MRITLAVLALAAAAGIASLGGPGDGYAGCLLLVCWFLVLRLLPEGRASRIWTVLLWASVGCGAIALVQLPWQARPPGPFGSPNYLGAFAAVMLLVAWRERGTIMGHAALGANALAVVLSQSRGALLAVGAGAAVLLWRRSRRIAVGAAGFALLGAVPLQRSEARLQVWELGLTVGLQRPLTGWGLGGVSHIVPLEGRLVAVGHFYSVPLDWFVATGALGLAAAIWLCVSCWRLANQDDRAILACWGTAGLFLSASWAMWLVLFTLLAELSRRVEIPGDEPDAAPVVDHRQPLGDRGAGALGAKRGHRGGDSAVHRP